VAVTANTGEIDERVLEIVAGLTSELQGALAPATVTRDQSLERDLAIGSLERVELLLRLERAFGVRLSDVAMMEAESPRDLARAVLVAQPVGAEPVQAPRAQDVQAPRAQDIQAPRSAEEQASRVTKARKLIADAEAACQERRYGSIGNKANEAKGLLK
jgi:acyl carrier protein